MSKGWVNTQISEIARVLSGFAFKSEHFNKIIGIPIIRIRDLPKGNQTETLYDGDYDDRYIVHKGDFLIGMDGEFHCYEWRGPEALLNQRVCRIQDFKRDLVEPRFIFFAVNKYLDKIEQDTGFTTVKHISSKQILEIEIPIPPLPEQKRIVDLISSVDSYIDALEQQAESARKSRNAVLHEMLSVGGEGWTETTLGEIVTVINGGTPSTKKSEYWDGEITWITTTELTHFDGKVIGNSQRTLTELGLKEGPSKLVEKGTILLGTTATIGTIGFVQKPVAFNQQISGHKVKSNENDPWFIFYYLQSIKYILENLSAGTSFKRIATSVLKIVPIKIPPLPEQNRIVDLISSVDSYIDALEQQAESARKSRSAVLHEMLSAGGDGWTETTLGEVAEIQMGQSPDGSTYNSEGVGLPFMQGSAEFGEHYPKPEKWCSEPKKIAEIGDLLLSVRAPVGDTNFADQRIAVGRGLSVIRAKSSLSDTKFIRMFIQSNINEMISNSGSGMFSSITGQNLRNFSVFLPPLPEQKRIVDLISSMDDGISATEKLISDTKQLRSGLLSDLLSGEHEIPQNYDKIMGAQ